MIYIYVYLSKFAFREAFIGKAEVVTGLKVFKSELEVIPLKKMHQNFGFCDTEDYY